MDDLGAQESVVAVIPCWNEPDQKIALTVEAVAAQTRPVETIVIVDDGSSIPVRVQLGLGNVKVIRTPRNLGISGARNYVRRNKIQLISSLSTAESRFLRIGSALFKPMLSQIREPVSVQQG